MRFDIDKAFGISQYTAALRSRRAGLLAANLANADTPNYKARDIDFREALDKLRNNTTNNSTLHTTHSRHITGTSSGMTDVDVIYKKSDQPTLDGNTVESHVEHAKFMENALRYQASLQFLNSSISGLKTALRGE